MPRSTGWPRQRLSEALARDDRAWIEPFRDACREELARRLVRSEDPEVEQILRNPEHHLFIHVWLELERVAYGPVTETQEPDLAATAKEKG